MDPVLGALIHVTLIIIILLCVFTTIYVLIKNREFPLWFIVIALFLTWNIPVLGIAIVWFIILRYKPAIR
jgi:hypothetical protein